VVVTNSESEKARDVTSIAIEIVSMWMPAMWKQPKASDLAPQEAAQSALARSQAFEHLDRVRRTEDPEEVFAGQLNLNMILLERLAISRGATSATLHDEVAKILQGIARELSEL